VPTLLAVDLGLRTGLALYGGDGGLLWYRSQNFGTAERLRRGVHGLLGTLLPELAWVVVEGGGNLAEIWEKEARRRGLAALRIPAEVWRERLLLPRDRRTGRDAKHTADDVARRVIAWSGAPRATSLRHDAAEAVLVGLWGVLEVGWLQALPPALRP
jgi:hypothetical protein